MEVGRYLIRTIKDNNIVMEEVEIVEKSPSGKYIKVKYQSNLSRWYAIDYVVDKFVKNMEEKLI